MRVLLARLAHELLRTAEAAVLPYGAELVELLEAALRDDTPDVACAACAAACALCAVAGRRLGVASTRLAEAATPLLTHRRAAVRLAALEAVRCLVQAGAHEHILELSAFAHPNEVPVAAFYGAEPARVNYLGKLATDAHAGVRAAFVRALADWLLRLHEREEHSPTLLPYVLSGLADDAPEVVAAAREAVAALGAAYEREHAEELREAERYSAPLEAEPPPEARMLAVAAARGSRLLVRQNVSRILPACVADLSSWTAHVRPRAAALLETLLACGADKAARHTSVLVPALCKACGDDNPRVVASAVSCCRLLASGAHVDEWLTPVRGRLLRARRLVCADAGVRPARRCSTFLGSSAEPPHTLQPRAHSPPWCKPAERSCRQHTQRLSCKRWAVGFPQSCRRRCCWRRTHMVQRPTGDIYAASWSASPPPHAPPEDAAGGAVVATRRSRRRARRCASFSSFCAALASRFARFACAALDAGDALGSACALCTTLRGGGGGGGVGATGRARSRPLETKPPFPNRRLPIRRTRCARASRSSSSVESSCSSDSVEGESSSSSAAHAFAQCARRSSTTASSTRCSVGVPSRARWT